MKKDALFPFSRSAKQKRGVKFRHNTKSREKSVSLLYALFIRIDVNNKGEAKRATARIFMAPKHGDGGVPWVQYADQRKMFIEMDRFVVKC